jgi:hypothetical protein
MWTEAIALLAILVLLCGRSVLAILNSWEQRRVGRFIAWRLLLNTRHHRNGTFIINESSISGHVWWTPDSVQADDPQGHTILYDPRTLLTNCPMRSAKQAKLQELFPNSGVITVTGSIKPGFIDFRRQRQPRG